MKHRIQKHGRGVLLIVMSIFMIALYAPNVQAQGRGSSKSGSKERVERKSETKQKATTRSSKRSSGKSEARTSRQKVDRDKKTGKPSTGRESRAKRSTSSRAVTPRARQDDRSRKNSGRVDVDRRDNRKTFKEVERKDRSDNSGRSGRGVRDNSGKSGDSGSRGSRNGRGVGQDDGNRGDASGRSRNGRAVGRDDNSRSNGSRAGRRDGNNNRGNRGVRVNNGDRKRNLGPLFRDRNNVKKYRHHKKHKWQHTYFRPDRVHVHVYPRNWHRHIHVSSHVHVGIAWPWQKRYHRHWRPRYRYRQVVYVNVGWGRHARRSRIDVRTYYNQRVRHANSDYAEIEIDIESIELYENGHFIGYVDRIPSKLREINATVYANGRVEFDRNVFLIGDTYRGFEMISTRYYDDYLLNSYDRRHGVRAGRVDLRRNRVKNIRRSRLFRPYDFNGNVPISLLPEDDRLFDYSYEYFSYYDDDYDYYGRQNSDFLGRNGLAPDRYEVLSDYEQGLSRIDEFSYSTGGGATVELTRESALERIN